MVMLAISNDQSVGVHQGAGFMQIQQLVRGEGGDASQQSCAGSFQHSLVRLQPARRLQGP